MRNYSIQFELPDHEIAGPDTLVRIAETISDVLTKWPETVYLMGVDESMSISHLNNIQVCRHE